MIELEKMLKEALQMLDNEVDKMAMERKIREAFHEGVKVGFDMYHKNLK